MVNPYVRKTAKDGIQLKDAEVVAALQRAIADYEDGALLEAQETLLTVCAAIDEFTNGYDE